MLPPTRPVRGRDAWGESLLDLGLALVALLLAWGIGREAPDLPAVRLLAGYTAVAGAAVGLLGLARLTALASRGWPTLERRRWRGEEAWRLRAWPGDWWHQVQGDVTLAVLAAGLTVVALDAGGEWPVLVLPVTAVGSWFAVRALLALLGRRHGDAVLLTDDEVVLLGPWGEARCPRDRVVRVLHRPGSRRVHLVIDGPDALRLCPRPWRGRGAPSSGALVVDASRTGHEPADLARWFEVELGAE